jgi:zinc protease
MRTRSALALALVAAASSACVTQGPVAAPQTALAAPAVPALAPLDAPPSRATPPEDAPPSPGPSLALHLPRTTWIALENGMRVGVARSATRPFVEVRLAIAGGRAFDGERTGLAALSAELGRRSASAEGSSRAISSRFAALGATLRVDAGMDATTFALRVPKAQLDSAVDALATLARTFEPSPREVSQARDDLAKELTLRAEEDADFDARMILFADLYDQPLGRHPYSSFDALPKELQSLTHSELRAYQRRVYTPRAMALVVAGDTTMEAARSAAERAFGAQRGAEPTGISFAEPTQRTARKVSIADRPGSAQAHVLVGWLGPERTDPRWPAARLAATVLASASGARGELTELAHGPSLWLAVADVPPGEAARAVEAVLASAERLASEPATPTELDAAVKRVFDHSAMTFGSLAQIADRAVLRPLLGLPEGADELALEEIRTTPPDVLTALIREFAVPAHAVIVVDGDATHMGEALARFADVKIVAPTRGFERDRTLRYNPAPVPPP